MELMTPVSMALTSWGINKFISGASHDLRFTIGQHGIDGKKSFYTRRDSNSSIVLIRSNLGSRPHKGALPIGL